MSAMAQSVSCRSHSTAEPLFSFGLVADVQYARKPPKATSSGSTRRYADSVSMLREAVEHWHQRRNDGLCVGGGGGRAAGRGGSEINGAAPIEGGQRGPSKLDFVLHLGDIIDGNDTPEATLQDLEESAAAFDLLEPLPVHHVVGNHCLRVPRETLVARLPSLRGRPHCYYSVPASQGWRLVVLDTTEMSFHSGYGPDSEMVLETKAFYDSHPLEQHPQMEPYNGGIGSEQMRWLSETLEDAERNNEAVIIAAHHPIASARESHRAWNAQDIEEALTRHASAVKLVLTGHDHGGGYAVRGGVHHVTLEGMVEAPGGSNAFATVHVCGDSIEIEGHGAATSRSLPI